MSDLSITAVNVVPDVGYQYSDGVAGETVTAGQSGYFKTSDSLMYKADANGTGDARVVRGIFLNGAAAGQPVKLITGGTLTIGATVASGAVYVSSATAGGIAPVADLATGWYTSIVCIGISTTKVRMTIVNSGVAVP